MTTDDLSEMTSFLLVLPSALLTSSLLVFLTDLLTSSLLVFLTDLLTAIFPGGDWKQDQ